MSEQAVADDGVTVTPPTTSAQLRMLRGDSTRYLCAGVYLDAEFRDAILHQLLGRQDRAVAPSFTTDAVPVVRHALHARHRQVVRDAVLTGVLVLLLVLEGRNLLAVVALYGAGLLTLRALRALAGLRMVAFIAQVFFALVAVLVAALLVQSNSDLLSSLTGSSSYDSGFSVKVFAGLAAAVFVLLVGVAWAAIVLERLANRQMIVEHLRPKAFSPDNAPPEPPARQARVRYITEAQTGNVAYYSTTAADRPFVGAGTPMEPWTLAVPLVPAGDGSETLAMTTESLEDAISLALAGLNPSDDAAGDEVSVQSRLVTPGTLRTGDPLLDPQSGLPRPRISLDEMHDLAAAETTGTNRYLCVRMSPRRADYEIWVFLHGQIQGRMLHLEMIGSCVPPVRAAFREIDTYSDLDNTLLLRNAFRSLLDLPGLLIRSPLRLLRAAAGPGSRAVDLRSVLGHLASTATPDRGAQTSVRELGTDPTSPDGLGNLTLQRQIRIIERHVIETITAAMEQAGFVTEEFIRRTQTIPDGPAR